MKARKIFWSEETRQKVINDAAKLIMTQQVDSMRKALLMANANLDVNLRRPLHGQPDFFSAYRKKVQARIEELKAAKPKETPVELPAFMAEAPMPDAPASLDRMVDVFVTSAVNLVTRRLEEELRQRIHHILMENSTENVQRTPAALMKVLIVGLNSVQQSEIKKKFDKLMNLRFFKEGSIHQLAATAANCRYVICMTDWINHSHSEAVKQVNAAGYTPVAGHLNALSEKLEELYAYA